ncbi:glycosyltransferase family 9 protein [Ekhidna sp. To15]|uniref:glycosyltransferase family 9 protein n=1 Tax=Ekhidna sp. To15 TaxID=3395267 RepID=UPI003F51ADA3
MKILIINTVSREKALFATPVIRLLKTALDAEVHLLVKKENGELFEGNPYLNTLHFDNVSIQGLRGTLKKEALDWIIDLQNDLTSTFLRFKLSKNFLAIDRHSFLHWLYVKTKINRLPKVHLVDQYIEILEPLGITGDNLGLDFFIQEKDEVENEWLPATHQNGYAAIALSASHHTKKLPVNRLIELCDRINKPVVLVGEADDQNVADEVMKFFKQGTAEEEEEIEELNKKTIIFNACGKFSFNQSVSLIKNASWVFTYDNVMMHIASAFKKSIFTIWGSTTPHFGTYAYRTQFTVFENNKLNCRPCSKSGFNNCPKGHFKCMNDVSFDFYLPD